MRRSLLPSLCDTSVLTTTSAAPAPAPRTASEGSCAAAEGSCAAEAHTQAAAKRDLGLGRERELLGALAAERRRHAVMSVRLSAYETQLPLLGLCVLSLAVLVFHRR